MDKRMHYENEGAVTSYFKDIRKYGLITKEEEIELTNKIKQGDEESLNKLMEANLKFVIKIAKEYQGNGLPLSDLISEGNYGMIKAANKFEPDKGYRFISYAVWWIKQSILQSLNDNSRIVRLPTNIVNKISSLKSQIEKFEHENEREPVFGEVLCEDGDVYDFETSQYRMYLNDCVNDDDNSTEFGDLLCADEEKTVFDIEEEVRIKNELNNVLSKLESREAEILKLYFGIDSEFEPMTLEAIGDRYDLTKERVRQIKERAILKLRHHAQDLHQLINS
jgi:RNA polymerase primary sigma factor